MSILNWRCKNWKVAKEKSYFDSLIEYSKITHHLWEVNCEFVKVRDLLNHDYIKTIILLHFYRTFNIYFSKNYKMHFSKALLYDIILIAQIFTTLATLNMINLSYDAKDKSNSKSVKFFANEIKDSKLLIKNEIDEQLKKRQIWIRLFFW